MAEHIYKHTPGPWRVQGGCEIVSPDGLSQGGQLYDIGCVYGTGYEWTREEAYANRRLMAAAPRLLKACNTVRDDLLRVISVIDNIFEFDWNGMEFELREAIKEATDE